MSSNWAVVAEASNVAALTVVATSDSDAAASYSSAAEWQQRIQWWCSVGCDGLGAVCFRGHDIAVACISVESLGSASLFFGGMDGKFKF